MYKQEVQKKNEERINRIFRDDCIPDFITRYFINLESSASKLNYWSAIKSLLQWSIDKKIIRRGSLSELRPEDLAQIETEDILLYLKEKENDGMAKSTLAIRKQIFTAFWGYLCRTSKVPVSVNMAKAVKYKQPMSNNSKNKFPTDAMIRQMECNIEHKKDTFLRCRNIAVLHVLLGTGIRESELAGLDVEDVYLNGNEKEHRPFIKVLGKGYYDADSKRTVLLTGRAVKAFQTWKIMRDVVPGSENTNAVFLNNRGQRLNTDNIKAIFRNYSDTLTPHMCRHWYATVMNMKYGKGFVSSQLGHSMGNVTEDSYINATYGIDLSDD